MITCRELVECLCDYVSNELPPERRDHVDKHLQTCPACRAYLQSYLVVIKLTSLLPAAPPPPALAQKLSAALAHQQRPAPGGA
jgi:anti-sigma factor RsiW